MSDRAKKAVAIGVAVVALAVGAFVLLGNRTGGLPGILDPGPELCPLSGRRAPSDEAAGRPAVAIKIENAPIAYPLSGLERAEVVYEELVEGGATRFLALYHCTDAPKAGPVRSARVVDPAVMIPATRILAFSGANDAVTDELARNDIVAVTETSDPKAFERIPREGLTLEHTLYADTRTVRRIGTREFSEAPPGALAFGDVEGRTRRARAVTIEFSPATAISYQWNRGKWLRFHGGEPFVDDRGEQIGVDNVVIEEHRVDLSKTIVDAAGNPSVEVSDPTGSGRALLFRDGRVVQGRWRRADIEGAVEFVTRSGAVMKLAPGTVWIHLVPSDAGDVKGSFSYES